MESDIDFYKHFTWLKKVSACASYVGCFSPTWGMFLEKVFSVPRFLQTVRMNCTNMRMDHILMRLVFLWGVAVRSGNSFSWCISTSLNVSLVAYPGELMCHVRWKRVIRWEALQHKPADVCFANRALALLFLCLRDAILWLCDITALCCVIKNAMKLPLTKTWEGGFCKAGFPQVDIPGFEIKCNGRTCFRRLGMTVNRRVNLVACTRQVRVVVSY
jgi:hypothetical protein